jgi:tetratricopeptide (TPR) repeat protein
MEGTLYRRAMEICLSRLKPILALATFGVAAFVALPTVLAAAGDPVEEELALRRRLLEEPESLEALEALAEHLVAQERTDEALSLLMTRGEGWLGAGEPAKAISVLTTAVRLAPESAEAFALLGRSHTGNRDFEAAEVALRRAIDLGYRDPTILTFLGAVLWESGRLEEAEPVYREAVELSGGALFPLAQLGRLLLWQGRYAEAADFLRQAAQRDPTAPLVHFDLAEALRGSDQVDEAIATYRRVTLMAPDLLKAHYGLAVLLARRGDAEASREVFEVYQRLYKEDQERTRMTEREEGEIDRGRALLRAGKAQEAIAHLDSLSESVELLLVKSQAYSAAGDDEAAVQALERAVILDPSRQDVRRLLADKRLERVGTE